jgi:hypothetical protein
MTPAEKRIKELIDRWLASIELHLQYVELSDEAYAEIQDWPKHDRPTRWVLELAKQKAIELRDAFDARHKMGDSKFADALELMTFLANLVGAQHVDRFIPLADPLPASSIPKPTPRAAASAPVTSDVPKWYAQAHASQPAVQLSKPAPSAAPIQAIQPQAMQPQARPAPMKSEPMPVAQLQSNYGVTGQFKPATRAAEPEATKEVPKPHTSFTSQPHSAAKPESKKSPAPPAAKQGAKAAPLDEIQTTVMADAVRLLGWGRTWHELAELIARMADRPPLAEVRKILRTHRAAIEKTSKESAK